MRIRHIRGRGFAPHARVLDVVIIGGGPAGLSAALVLGRCRRRVLVCDEGRPRNAAATALHGYLTRDGTPPLELLRLGREELHPYDVEFRRIAVSNVVPQADGFLVRLENGEEIPARKVLIATGVRDQLPPIDGLEACYGVSVHHCPYCDGWEVRDRALVVLGRTAGAAGLALALKTWSARVTLCTNGQGRLGALHRAQLAAHGIAIDQRPVLRLEHIGGRVHALAMGRGEPIACEALFFSTGQTLQCDFPERLGCTLTRKGIVKTDHLGQTTVPGLYVVGDASRDVQFVIVAAAEGAKAGVAINKALQASAGLVAAPVEA